MLTMNEDDIIKEAHEIRRRINDMEVRRTVYCDLDDLAILTNAIGDFTKAEIDKNSYLKIQNALKIIKSYSKLSIHIDIEPSEGVFAKYNNLVEQYNQLEKEKDDMKMRNNELFTENKTLANAIGILTEKLEKLNIKLDGGTENPLST